MVIKKTGTAQKWTEEETLKLVALANKGLDNQQLSRELNRSVASIKNKKNKLRDKLGIDIPMLQSGAKNYDVIYDIKLPVWDQIECIKTKDIMITSDWHMPAVNVKMKEWIVALARKNGIKKLAIIGDFFSLEIFSSFKQAPKDATSVITELEIAKQLLIELMEHFDEVYMLKGNHEERMFYKMDGKEDFWKMWNWITGGIFHEVSQKIYVMNQRKMLLDTGDDYLWRLTHQKNYSNIPLNVPRRISYKFSDQHIITSHTHGIGIGFTDDGKRIIAESGCMTDKRLCKYVNEVDNTYRTWTPGFIMMKNGIISIHSERIGE